MNNFIDGLTNEATKTRTENGAAALSTTGSFLLDLYSVAGSIRHKDAEQVCMKFDLAYNEDSLRAMKLLFHIRDIREGLGERKTFRTIFKRMADLKPDVIIANLDLVPVYGRFDDLYSLIGTRAEDEMWKYMRTIYDADLENMNAGKPISLLAKWVANDTSGCKETEKLGKLTINKLGFKKTGYVECSKNFRKMRKYLNIPEIAIAAADYSSIEYSKLASRCLQKYRKAFVKRDKDRFDAYINSVSRGEAKMNVGTVTPGDIVHNLVKFRDDNTISVKCEGTELALLLEQWNNQKSFLSGKRILSLLDTSGSMLSYNGKAIEQATGLAIYCSEHIIGEFADCIITFTSHPKFVKLPHNANLVTKIEKAFGADWGYNTNVYAAFKLILDTAIKHKVPQEEMPECLLVLSDMQFDSCDDSFTSLPTSDSTLPMVKVPGSILRKTSFVVLYTSFV